MSTKRRHSGSATARTLQCTSAQGGKLTQCLPEQEAASEVLGSCDRDCPACFQCYRLSLSAEGETACHERVQPQLDAGVLQDADTA